MNKVLANFRNSVKFWQDARELQNNGKNGEMFDINIEIMGK